MIRYIYSKTASASLSLSSTSSLYSSVLLLNNRSTTTTTTTTTTFNRFCSTTTSTLSSFDTHTTNNKSKLNYASHKPQIQHQDHIDLRNTFPSENVTPPPPPQQSTIWNKKEKFETIIEMKRFDIKLDNVNYSLDLSLNSRVGDIISQVWLKKLELDSQDDIKTSAAAGGTVGPRQMRMNPLFYDQTVEREKEKTRNDKSSYVLVIDGLAHTSNHTAPLIDCNSNSIIRLELKSEHSHPYAKKITFSKVGEELFSLYKSAGVEFENETLDDQEIREYISMFENELAICQPQMLRDILNEKKLMKKVFYSMIEYMEEQIAVTNQKQKLAHRKENTMEDFHVSDQLKTIANLKHPHNWFPVARGMKRKFILHVGPTNSGKTHNALKRLMEAENGVFCGPLRMLAHQVYEKLNTENIPCNLTTGQQVIVTPNARHTAYTVEMASTRDEVDVAVIDEFQMLSDIDRGFAWTRAILGIPAKEIHLCGDNTSVELVKRMLDLTGDTIEVNYYDRLSPLVVDTKPASLGRLEKGDCVVAFSRREVLTTKASLEKMYGKKCSVVYGALPPEARVQQTRAFNDTSSDVQVIVATDAIGMGLNLNIKRIIFSTIKKFDGKQQRLLKHSELKQIAGRAGRFASAYNVGMVTCTNARDLPTIKKLLELPNVANERAGVFPQWEQLETFSTLQDNHSIPFSELMTMFIEHTELDNLYFLEDIEDKLRAAKLIDHLDMEVSDRYIFIMAPIKNGVEIEKKLVQFATQFSNNKEVRLREKMPEFSSSVSKQKQLVELEIIYAISDLYLWLGQRFRSRFQDVEKASQICNDINEAIPLLLQDDRDTNSKKKKRSDNDRERRRIHKELSF
ncbi:Mitochondrial RNA helicase [Cavenderia fasciculata]|uniref:RNA helicase n=1 Tax=Cavenderia fasciculata TaxID=261658 RepID=F4PJZ5_CACFS|nr:Mitochondrial RNA helicase [Cavenderia fasciculata]EGG23919.1 Mitochondrial RNA helicase [Cavenderia fasciculata]|eukprot:XP_004361770.1 Mitochondrial RNA helicase [Cavenderia fasciculata]